MISLKALNIDQLNVYKILLLVHKVLNNNIAHVLKQSFSEIDNNITKNLPTSIFISLYLKQNVHNVLSVIIGGTL